MEQHWWVFQGAQTAWIRGQDNAGVLPCSNKVQIVSAPVKSIWFYENSSGHEQGKLCSQVVWVSKYNVSRDLVSDGSIIHPVGFWPTIPSPKNGRWKWVLITHQRSKQRALGIPVLYFRQKARQLNISSEQHYVFALSASADKANTCVASIFAVSGQVLLDSVLRYLFYTFINYCL